MASAIASEGTLRIHRSIAGTAAPFRVTFQPYHDSDEPAPAAETAFYHLQDVREFLHVLGLGAEYIREALRELDRRTFRIFDQRRVDREGHQERWFQRGFGCSPRVIKDFGLRS